MEGTCWLPVHFACSWRDCNFVYWYCMSLYASVLGEPFHNSVSSEPDLRQGQVQVERAWNGNKRRVPLHALVGLSTHGSSLRVEGPVKRKKKVMSGAWPQWGCTNPIRVHLPGLPEIANGRGRRAAQAQARAAMDSACPAHVESGLAVSFEPGPCTNETIDGHSAG